LISTLYKEYETHFNSKFTEVYVCQKIIKLVLSLTHLLQKQYGTVFSTHNVLRLDR